MGPAADRPRTGLGRRVARGVAQRVRQVRHAGPEVSVVVPFYKVEQYLAACLDSILGQSFGDLEVLLVDDGSPDGSRAIAEEYAARDDRIRILTRENGGLGAARNTGVREARGRYLTFVDSDDLLPADALALLVGSAEETGSEIVCGSIERFDSRRTWLPPWRSGVHLWRRQGITVEDFLPLLRNLYTCDKLFRRDFFLAQGLWFREGVAYEDQPLVTQLLARATSIDVLPEVVYRYRARDDGSSISQQTSTVRDLRDRVEAWRASREALRRDLSARGYAAWLGTLFEAHFRWYLTNTGTSDDTYWELVQQAVAKLSAEAPAWVWDATPPPQRVMVRLAQLDRRADLRELVRREGMRLDRWPSRVREDGILVELPFLGDPDLDEALFVLRPEQVRVAHLVESARWTGGATGPGLSVAGWAFLEKVDLATHESRVTLLLRREGTGEVRAFPAAPELPAAGFNPPQDDPWCDYWPGRFVARIDAEGLAGAGPDDAWQVWLRVEAAGLTAEEPLVDRAAGGSAERLAALPVGDGARLVADWPDAQPLRLRVEHGAAVVDDLRVADRTVSGVLDAAHAQRVVAVEAVSGSERVTGAWTSRTDDGRAFEVVLPAPTEPDAAAPRSWTLGAVDAEGRRADLVPRGGTLAPLVAARLIVETGDRGEVLVREWERAAVADRLELSPDGVLTVEGRLVGGDAPCMLTTTDGGERVVGEPTRSVDGRFTASLELRHPRYRFGRWPLGTGEHPLSLAVGPADGDAAGPGLPLLVGPPLGERLPVPLGADGFEGRVTRGVDDVVVVTLRRQLGGGRGQYRQRLLREGPRRPQVAPGVLLRTSHAAGILAALQRRGSDLPVHWAVPDRSVPVPPGAVPVVVGSPEYHDAASTSAYVVDDEALPPWQSRTPGQVLVRMGHHPSPREQRSPTAARAPSGPLQVDYVASPARYATPVLARALAGAGEVLDIGSPRNDVLHSDRAGELREAVRASLGIAPDQVAVLYAPQHRERHPASHARGADLLDLRALAQRLGPRHVVLVHGHAFRARPDRRLSGVAGCREVTDHPEPSDLLLAADAAVLDYSPLRFDAAATGIPLLFLVPDRRHQRDGHDWGADSEPTAPGPLLDTTDDVVEALLDLDGVRARYAAERERFRASFLDLEDGAAGERLLDSVLAPRGDA